jgi:hypothetical protein
MGYYMRYISADSRPLELGELAKVLADQDPAYRLTFEGNEGILHYGEILIGHLELNLPGDGIFDEELAELREFAEDADGAAESPVPAVLNRALAVLAVRVLRGTGETETILQRLDPIWAWLFEHRRGLMQADGEGYYDSRGLVLLVE